MFYTIKDECSAQITEKKSKFICNVFHVESVQEAEDKFNIIRKKYHDARHNCYVYKVVEEDAFKASDDGEPSGTAGVPMLNIVNGRNLSNILVVVTRYFGGILLGTGGLVRAYSLATTTALDDSNIIKQEMGLEASFNVEYKELEEVKYHLKNRNIVISGQEYLENVKVFVEGREEDILKLQNEKLSERVELKDFVVLKKKYIEIEQELEKNRNILAKTIEN